MERKTCHLHNKVLLGGIVGLSSEFRSQLCSDELWMCNNFSLVITMSP